MSLLANYRPDTVEIPFVGGRLPVRGVTLADVSDILRAHAADIETLVAACRGAKSGENTTQAIMRVVRAVPKLMAQIIACACDEPEEVEAASRLPLPVTIAALIAIDKLSFPDKAARRAFVESVSGMMAKASPSPEVH